MNYKRTPLQLNSGKAEIITIQTNDQNSLDRKNMKELASILDEIKKDDTIKGAIITSDHPKFFCNGLDAQTILNTPKSELADAVGAICVLFGDLLRFDKPLITEVTGHAMGGGAVITIASDYKYMLDAGCRISFTEVMVGLPLPGMFVYKIQESVHPTKVNEICLEAASYKGKEAKEVGFVDDTAPTKEELRKLSTKKFDTLFRLPMSALRLTKQNINMKSIMDYDKHLQITLEGFNTPIIQENMFEFMRALLEKRRPNMK